MLVFAYSSLMKDQDNRINKNSSIPAYYQMQRIIRDQIESGMFTRGQQLPSERELSERYDVSRITARKAIRGLINEGLCTRNVGRGIFVAQHKIPMNMTYLEGTTQFFANAGVASTTRLVNIDVVVPPHTIAGHLCIAENASCLRVIRVRYVDDCPVMLERAHVSPAALPLDREAVTGQSLYAAIAAHSGLQPKYARGHFNVVLAGETAAAHLDVPLDFALLEKQTTVYGLDSAPIEYNITTYRTDKFEFIIDERARDE